MIPIHVHIPRAALLALTASVSLLCWSQEPPGTADVLSRLREMPYDLSLVKEAKSAGAALQAKAILNQELEKESCGQMNSAELNSSESVMKCTALALGLQTLNPEENAGKKMLAQWMGAFLAQRIPLAFLGESVGGKPQFTPEYREWSRQHGLSPGDNVWREAMYGSGLLRSLAFEVDPEFRPLFRRALESNSTAVVLSATTGLALLGDKDALSAILASAERQKPHGIVIYYSILGELRNYRDPEVDRLIETKIADKQWRDEVMSRPVPPVTKGMLLR